MKKFFTAALLSTSICVAPMGYTQSLYEKGNHRASEPHEETTTEINAIPIVPILIWFFRGIAYWALSEALDAAWEEFNAWWAEWGETDNPDLTDPRIKAVCDFVEENADDPDVKELQAKIEGLCI